jgi:hypothetical protein
MNTPKKVLSKSENVYRCGVREEKVQLLERYKDREGLRETLV